MNEDRQADIPPDNTLTNQIREGNQRVKAASEMNADEEEIKLGDP